MGAVMSQATLVNRPNTNEEETCRRTLLVLNRLFSSFVHVKLVKVGFLPAAKVKLILQEKLLRSCQYLQDMFVLVFTVNVY